MKKPIVIETATAGDVIMDYCRFGDGEKVFVILPGLSLRPVSPAAMMLAHGFAAFTEEYTVYLFDRRTNYPESYTMEQMAADTAAVMRKLNLAHTAVFGASQGGMIALLLAMDYPELVDQLVLGSSGAHTVAETEAVLRTWLSLAEAGNGTALNENITETLYSPDTLKVWHDVLLSGGKDLTEAELRRYIVMSSAILNFDISGRLGELSCKTLVLGCEGDRIMTPGPSREIAERLNCDVYMYGREYGHAVYDEAPDYRGRILDFLEKSDRAAQL